MTYIHPKIQKAVAQYTATLPQGLLIVGKQGAGAQAIAEEIARSYTKTPFMIYPEKNEKLDTENGSIGVELVRRLYDITRGKMASKQIVIITQSERMTHQAQGALLKILEEPNDNVHFILLASDTAKLLDTIKSRVQQLVIEPLSREQSEALLDDLKVVDSKKRQQILFIASGLPEEISRLAHQDDYLEARAEQVRMARTLLQDTPYEKLKSIQSLKDNRATSKIVVEDALRILEHSLHSSPSGTTLERLEIVLDCERLLSRNANIRLTLMKAFL
jgi:DNA polymerase-3 subunit delta'